MISTKEELRVEYLKKRKALSPRSLQSDSEAIIENALSAFQITGKMVSLFLPIERHFEINTYSLWEKIVNLDGFVAVPKVNDNKTDLKHILFTDKGQLKTSKWGIPEPTKGKIIAAHKIDIVFVPLLCFDKNGHRVGYGGGFYDRFLKKCKSNCLFIGLSLFDCLESPISDAGFTDIQLHACVTPEGIIRF